MRLESLLSPESVLKVLSHGLVARALVRAASTILSTPGSALNGRGVEMSLDTARTIGRYTFIGDREPKDHPQLAGGSFVARSQNTPVAAPVF